MSVEQVRTALDDRFGAAAQPRPHRPRAAPHADRRHRVVLGPARPSRSATRLARLSVFHDGFDRGHGRGVLGAEGMDLVEALVDQSIVTVAEAAEGATRFRMLETIREFAGQRLVESGAQCRGSPGPGHLGGGPRHRARLAASSPRTRSHAVGVAARRGEQPHRRAASRPGRGRCRAPRPRCSPPWAACGPSPATTPASSPSPTRRSSLLADWDPETDRELDAGFEAAALLLVHLSWIPGRDTDELRNAVGRWGEPQHAWAQASPRHVHRLTTTADVVTRIVDLADAETDPTNAADAADVGGHQRRERR